MLGWGYADDIRLRTSAPGQESGKQLAAPVLQLCSDLEALDAEVADKSVILGSPTTLRQELRQRLVAGGKFFKAVLHARDL